LIQMPEYNTQVFDSGIVGLISKMRRECRENETLDFSESGLTIREKTLVERIMEKWRVK
jgi:hypothetical protein